VAERRNTVASTLFGLDREQKIATSGVRNIFTPHQPISEIDLLLGRQAEVQSLVQTLNTPGQHVLLYGERGVGKSSLANVVSTLLRIMIDTTIFVKRCDQSDTFESILLQPLAEVGADLTLTQVDSESTKKAGVDLKAIKGEKARAVVSSYQAHHTLSPSTVAEAAADLSALLVVDEADAIGNSEDRRKLAELIKLLSDSGSKFKVMVVGIANTGAELTAAHPSVQRCLKETKLERMDRSELREIVETGSGKANITFSSRVIDSIVEMSSGYPHFTHLIALKCAENAVAADRTYIDETHLSEALGLAVRDAEGTLKREYDDAVRSYATGMYGEIVTAAAVLSTEEFSAASLRESIERRTGKPITQGSLNSYLQRLVSDDGSSILRRKAKGVYCFSDPRMPSYARMNAVMVPAAVLDLDE
jgi:SpoVK/Ycf46/Vps4 family AAA+-type ATPase